MLRRTARLSRGKVTVTSLCVGLAVTVITGILWRTESIEAESPDPASTAPRPVDVLMLLDCSPSTLTTDPEGTRFEAARFLIDYLQLLSDLFDINYRAGFANFGGEVGENSPLRLPSSNLRQQLRKEEIPATDFRPALQFAHQPFCARRPSAFSSVTRGPR